MPYADKEQQRLYRSEYNRKRRKLFPEYYRKACRDSYWKHRPEYLARYRDKYRKLKSDPIAYQKYLKSMRELRRNRHATDLRYRLYCQIRSRINGAIMRKTCKAGRTTQLIGCSIEELRSHIESQWKPGMSWENHKRVGGWHIDHIVPCASFDLTDPEQQKKCFHYTNLQPLWELDNLRKWCHPSIPN